MTWRAALLLALACALSGPGCTQPPAPLPPRKPISRFQDARFVPAIRRVLLVPPANESGYPQAAAEVADALAAELQSLGRFEVVLAPAELGDRNLGRVHLSGAFDEAELVQLAHEFQADAVLVGSITQYHPYLPPCLGLTIQMVSPIEGVVIASVDGLWDSRDRATAELARAYAAQHLSSPQGSLGNDVVLASPRLYQRFVCREAAQALVSHAAGPPSPQIPPDVSDRHIRQGEYPPDPSDRHIPQGK